MKTNLIIRKTVALFLMTSTLGILSTSAQDSVRVRNRHNVPDTIIRDTTKLDGGALIDTIHTDRKNNKPGIERTDTTSSIKLFHENTYAFQDDSRSGKIAELEKKIAVIKSSLNKTSTNAQKSEVATFENKKNDLKARLSSETANDQKEKDRWNNDYNELMKKLDATGNN